jgi:AraC-like DNA-binding protein
LPLPFDRRLRKVCAAVLQAPGNDDTLEQWGERMGASARTLARRMKDETGMSFHNWRLQVRIDEGICRLLQGQSVVSVARALGYASASAFVYMFRNVMGVSPTRYLEQIAGG